MTRQIRRYLLWVVFASAAALFVDLFLGWQSLADNLRGPATVSGWHGWGVFSGFLLMLILIREITRVAGAPVGSFSRAVFAGGALAFVILRFRDVGDVDVGGASFASVAGRLWPAWAGVVVAVILVVATFAELFLNVVAHMQHHHGSRVQRLRPDSSFPRSA